MLEKKYRIERNKVQYILKKGEDSISKLFIIRYIKNNENYNRYCTVVSKKIDPKAVGRNRLRRQIYEAIRGCEGSQSQLPGTRRVGTGSQSQLPGTRRVGTAERSIYSHLDSVLIPKKSILKAKFEDIEADIKSIITTHEQI